MNKDLLKNSGLNLFAAVKVNKLPKEILLSFDSQNITYSDDDTLCIVDNGGKSLWNKLFPLKLTSHHPIDEFTIDQMKNFGTNIKILYPNIDYLIPLQKIGRFLNLSRKSLLGIDISKDFGLWFAYRGVFLTKEKIFETNHPDFLASCDQCETKPCITACHALAVSTEADKFNIIFCIDYQKSENSKCLSGCVARITCPYQADQKYSIEQIQYHNLKKPKF